MSEKFAEQMLGATFDFARLALSNAILINGAAATALMAFLTNRSGEISIGFAQRRAAFRGRCRRWCFRFAARLHRAAP